MKKYKIPTTFLLLLTVLFSSLHASYQNSDRAWELKVSNDIETAEPYVAAQRFLNELRISQTRERQVKVFLAFQRILEQSSEEYPTQSLPDDDTRSSLLSLKESFGAIEIDLQMTDAALVKEIEALKMRIGLEDHSLRVPDRAIGDHREALFAIEALRILHGHWGNWHDEAERSFQLKDPIGAYDAAVRAISSQESTQAQLAILKEFAAQVTEQHERLDNPASSRAARQTFSSMTMIDENLKLLDFQFDDAGRLNNADYLRIRVVGGVAPRTDVPTISDIRKYPSVVLTLRIIEAISGEPDPILERARQSGLI